MLVGGGGEAGGVGWGMGVRGGEDGVVGGELWDGCVLGDGGEWRWGERGGRECSGSYVVARTGMFCTSFMRMRQESRATSIPPWSAWLV